MTPRTIRTLFPWSPILAAGILFFAAASPACGSEATGGEASLAAFGQNVRPLLMRLCVECHGPQRQEADVRLDTLDPNMATGPDAETWHDALNKLNLGEMPPAKAPQPTAAQRSVLTDWLTQELARAAAHRRSTGGQVVLRRLTRYEYANTMRDLLGLDLDYAKDLPPEPTSAEGFQNNGAALRMSPLQVEYYLETARQSLRRAIVTGPQPPVVQHHAEKSEPERRVKGDVANELGRSNRFLMRMNEFPREGEVRILVRAAAKVPPGAPYPRLRVALGVRADTEAPEKTLAEVDVTSTEGKSATFEFRGRIEDFPLPGHNPKFPGLQVTLYNVSAAGKGPAANAKGTGNVKNPLADSLIVIESVDFEGPLLESWPPPSHTRIFFTGDPALNEADYARQVIQRFMTRAYRRPVTSADVEVIYTLYEKIRPQSPSLEEAMRQTLPLVLISPDFLFLVEPREPRQATARLNEYELASRLSYFLWSSMPDDELFRLAAEGRLHDAAVLKQQVERMLADERSQELVERFSSQWLDLSGVDRVAVNPEFYPGFDDAVKQDMRRETQEFFAVVLRENLSCLTLLDADFTMLNRRLAEHYGLEGPRGSQFERVSLPADSERGGLLTQGSFLLSNSNGEDSHPIKRAVWLLDRLLDSPPAPPPPDVPDLDQEGNKTEKLTLKQRLEAHRQKESCNNCHRGIDPWGVVFEHYDALGRWRTEVQGGRGRPQTPVDATSTLPDGTQLDGVAALKKFLQTERREQFARSVVKRLLAYSLGRSLELADEPTVVQLADNFREQDYRLHELIAAIVQSEPFLTK